VTAAIESDSGDDLIDRIANALPAEVRAAYYRELTHCRSLPDNDEMLRILRAMQFLTLLMNQVPDRVIAERERFERLFGTATLELHQTIASSQALHNELQRRLSALPAEVARGLSAPAIAREINESLQQQFIQSTIPDTARALTLVAAEMKKVSGEFGLAARAISEAHRGAAAQARQAIDNLDSSILAAANTARRAAQELSNVFQHEFRWSLYALSGLALVIGLFLGMLFERWIETPPQIPKAENVRSEQPASPAKTTRP